MRKNKKLGIFILMCVCASLHAQSLLEKIPLLSHQSISFLQSTYDRTGLNDDHITPQFHNYYDVIPQGKVNNPNGTATSKKEYVLCNVTGPAILERFWMIPLPLYFDARFRFYFDGETTPRVNKSFNELFFVQTTPFVKPLVQNLYESSGGFWSYIPMPVAKSLIVTVDTAAVFAQFEVKQLPRDTTIPSWTAAQDNSYLVDEFNKSGNYPKDNAAQLALDSFNFGIFPGQTTELFHKFGSFTIDGIKMQLPQLDYTYSSFVKDRGNFHKGTSKFTLNINGNADSILLIKRSNKTYHLVFDFNNLSESAAMKVDNQSAGTWTNKDYRSWRYWEDDTFRIPKNLYTGKSQITIQAQYTSGEPWCEYYYWISCNNVRTDSVDVATTANETAHSYSVNNVQANLYSEISNRYDAPSSVKQKNKQLLDSIWIHIYFDGEITPSVSAPVGLFFGTGVNDAAYMKSIAAGNINGEFYNYLSMPFWQSAHVTIENKSSTILSNSILKVLTSPNSFTKENVGYLKTAYNKGTKGFGDRTDYVVANVAGRGNYVGTVIEADQNNDTSFCWLEGDERIYTDDNRTPLHYGTGTEDYFNSTFYFYLDEYSLPENGMTNSDLHYHKSMYRFHLTDPIPFEKNIRFQIEHGDYNNKLGNYQSVAFYYVQPSVSIPTDSINVGVEASENAHQYMVSGSKVSLTKSSSFEGEQYTQSQFQNGYAIADSVQFTVSIQTKNAGARLLRTFDYSYKNQQAKVYVDDSLAGEWLNAGFNNTSQFREEYFSIPAKFTRNKSSLKIKIVNEGSTNWTELFYKVYTIVDSSLLTNVMQPLTKNYKLYPNITRDKVYIESDENKLSFLIYNSNGNMLKSINGSGKFTALDFSEYTAGTYFIAIFADKKLISTDKIILVH